MPSRLLPSVLPLSGHIYYIVLHAGGAVRADGKQHAANWRVLAAGYHPRERARRAPAASGGEPRERARRDVAHGEAHPELLLRAGARPPRLPTRSVTVSLFCLASQREVVPAK